jgi:hypothetical protein
MKEEEDMKEGKAPSFRNDPEVFHILENWWDRLGNGDRAMLRRTKDVDEVETLRPFHVLRLKLEDGGYSINGPALAVVASTLPFVKADRNGVRLGVLLADRNYRDTKLGRFSSIRRNDKNKVRKHLVGIVRYLSGEAPIRELADLAYWWNKRTVKELVYDYYSKDEGSDK